MFILGRIFAPFNYFVVDDIEEKVVDQKRIIGRNEYIDYLKG